MTPLAASISDATIWSFTFDNTRSVDYDRNSFIIQATVVSTYKISIYDEVNGNNFILFLHYNSIQIIEKFKSWKFTKLKMLFN